MKVLKFGGTSVGTADAIRQVLKVLSTRKDVVVVVSALGGVTNNLIKTAELAATGNKGYHDGLAEIDSRHMEIIRELIKTRNQTDLIGKVKLMLGNLEDLLHGIYLVRDLSPRSLDLVQSYGERLSAQIIATFLNQEGVKASYVDSREIVETDDSFGRAKVNFTITNRRAKKELDFKKQIPIVTGFIGYTKDRVTTTLGRGGSDFTASILAAALGAEELEIWTDVDGVMTADPRRVKDAFSIKKLSYNEAMELSYFGAKVIYPPTLQPVINKKIPLVIRNTFNQTFEGTVIHTNGESSKRYVKGIASVDQISLISVIGSGLVGVPGTASRLFGALAKEGINVILISQASSEHSICLAVSPGDAKRAVRILSEEFEWELERKRVEKIIVEEDLSILAIVGERMKHRTGISSKLFSTMGHNGINISAIAQGSSELNISVVIPRKDLVKALNAVHEAFFLSDLTRLNVYLVGTGLIGSTLLDQIGRQKAYLEEKLKLDIKLAGLANSRNASFNKNGIAIKNWRKLVDKKGPGTDLDDYIKEIKELNLQNSVFVDCTSSEDVIKYYGEVLDSSISIVTPNKLANSSSLANYNKLKTKAFNKGVKFLYETNVGAGLPVINTLQDLLHSGDQVHAIEGVLSGTLSYIFNSYDGSVPFSEVVKVAKEKGYTEPDPRDDLNGQDVARKILILAREAGFELEPSDVKVKPFISESAFKAKSVDDFFKVLKNEDATLETILKKAEKKGQVLRYIAKMSGKKATVSLEAVDASHPFFSLSGSDNIIAFATERYNERPLVIKGPGAGAEVTAAGVFAEMISVSNIFGRNG